MQSILNYYYSVPYVLSALLLLALGLYEYRQPAKSTTRNVLEAIAVLYLLWFMGLRGYIYTDWYIYRPWYLDLPNIFNLTSDNFSYFEPLFVIYSSLCKTISDDFFAWQFINAAIDIGILLWFFRRYTKAPVLAFFFMFVFYGLYMEFNLFRNMKSIMLFLISVPYLEKRRAIPYMLLNLAGSWIHSSSLLYLPLYFVFNMTIRMRWAWVVVVLANLIYLSQLQLSLKLIGFISNILPTGGAAKVDAYVNSAQAITLGLGWVERTFSVVLFILTYNKLVAFDSRSKMFFNIYLTYYVMSLVLVDVQVFTERVPYLFTFAYWVIYTNLAYVKFAYKKIVYLCVILFCMAKLVLGNVPVLSRYDNITMEYTDAEIRAIFFRKFYEFDAKGTEKEKLRKEIEKRDAYENELNKLNGEEYEKMRRREQHMIDSVRGYSADSLDGWYNYEHNLNTGKYNPGALNSRTKPGLEDIGKQDPEFVPKR